MIREYTEQWQDFQIHICDIHLIGDTVVIVGPQTRQVDVLRSGALFYTRE